MKKGLNFSWFAVLLLASITFANSTLVSTSREKARKVYAPAEKEQFSFVILGDCTSGGFAGGLEVMTNAVREINIFKPEFVFTIGDLIPGYNGRSAWMKQAKAYRKVVKSLEMEWYPVAGNHDVYWRGEGGPKTEHEEVLNKIGFTDIAVKFGDKEDVQFDVPELAVKSGIILAKKPDE